MEEATKKTEEEEIEGEISRAMHARVRDFKEQADSLTLEGVRRAIERDLGMEKFSLDVHKKFIKQCLNECFFDVDGETESKTVGTSEEAVQPVEKETSIQHEDLPPKKTGSPALSGMENGTENSQVFKYDSDLSEDKIKNAITKRAAYVRANITKITSAEVRRLLEEDLKLKKNTLDAYKGFISEELDEVLLLPEAVEATNGVKKPKKASHSKASGKANTIPKSSSKDSDSLDSNDDLSGDEEVIEETRPRKRPAQKIKASTIGLKKQKKSVEDSRSPRSRKKKQVDTDLDKSSEREGGNSSEGDQSNSSAEENIKKKIEKPTQAYGKKVEHLKSIIKSCGMGVPPSVYKRAKQVPENKREAFLLKELEEILEREGLSTNPSEKEIKAVKKKKERAKELEGIDMSNIVSSSRRRTTSHYIPPPKPKVEVEIDDDEEDEDDEGNDEEDTDDDGGSGEGSDEDEESD